MVFDEGLFPAKDTSPSPHTFSTVVQARVISFITLPTPPLQLSTSIPTDMSSHEPQPMDHSSSLHHGNPPNSINMFFHEPQPMAPSSAPHYSTPPSTISRDHTPHLDSSHFTPTTEIAYNPPLISLPLTSPTPPDLTVAPVPNHLPSQHSMVTRSQIGSSKPKQFADFSLFYCTKHPFQPLTSVLPEHEPTAFKQAQTSPEWC